jgi:hypothetical protein
MAQCRASAFANVRNFKAFASTNALPGLLGTPDETHVHVPF